MKCFYHRSDLDGHCSGALIKLKYPQCETIGVNYGDTIRDTKIEPGEDVYVVDFRFPMEEMIELNNKYKLHFIDHHKTAIDEAMAEGFLASGGQILDSKVAACELVWNYLYPDENVPYPVWMLSRYDTWEHELIGGDKYKDVLPFQYGMRLNKDTTPDHTDLWFSILYCQKNVHDTIEIGKTLQQYQESQDAKFAKSMAFEAEFEGYRAIVANKPFCGSKIFDSVYDPDKHDIMMLFGYKPPQFKYSIYCNKPDIDVSEIAKKYGGGGHKGAAGFETDWLIFQYDKLQEIIND